MSKTETEAIWSWNYNHGKAYPMPCKKCGTLVEMEKIRRKKPSLFLLRIIL